MTQPCLRSESQTTVTRSGAGQDSLDWTQESQDSVFNWTKDKKEQKKRRIEYGSIVTPSTGVVTQHQTGEIPTFLSGSEYFFFGCIYGSGSFDGELWTPLWTLTTDRQDHQDRYGQDRLTTAWTLWHHCSRSFNAFSGKSDSLYSIFLDDNNTNTISKGIIERDLIQISRPVDHKMCSPSFLPDLFIRI